MQFEFATKAIIDLINDPAIEAIVQAGRHGQAEAVLRHGDQLLVLVRVGLSPNGNRFHICNAQGKVVAGPKSLWGLSSTAYFLAHLGWADCQVEPIVSKNTAKRLLALLVERRKSRRP